MTRFLLLPLLLLACGSKDAYLPDGGRIRETCFNTGTTIPVTAVDAMGNPVGGANVTARNTTNGKVVTTTTGGNGATNGVTDDLGNGQLEITATNGTISTKQPFIVNVTCGECDCTATPGYATLKLE